MTDKNEKDRKPRTKRQRHIGYVLVPIVDDDGNTPLLPSIWRAWSLPITEETPEHQYVVIWTSRAAANRAHRKLFGARDKTMKVCRIRLENV